MNKISLLMFLIMALLFAACNGEAVIPTDIPSTETLAEPTAEPETEVIEAPVESVSVDIDMLTSTTWAWAGFTDPMELHPGLPG